MLNILDANLTLAMKRRGVFLLLTVSDVLQQMKREAKNYSETIISLFN